MCASLSFYLLFALLIASISLPGRHYLLRVLTNILCERFSGVYDVIEFTFFVPSNVALIRSCINQLSFAPFCVRCHDNLRLRCRFRVQAGE